MNAVSMEWVRAALTVLFGSLAGGITNRVAIWMLFHPYNPPRLFGRPFKALQGAVPKNQARLASSIGRTVGTRLLTSDDVAAELQDEALQAAFDDKLRRLLAELVERDLPAIGDLLPEPVAEEVRHILDRMLIDAQDRFVVELRSGAFQDEAERLLTAVASSVEGDVSDALDPERVALLRERLDSWASELVSTPAFEGAVREHLERAARQILQPGHSFEEIIPTGLVAALEHAIRDYLPVAMERLGRLLEDPAARERVEGAVHSLLDRFMADLRFHQRVVAKLIITEDTVDRVIDALEAEGADRVGELLREPEVQDAMARNVNDGIVEFLRRPTTKVLGELEDPQVQSAIDSVTGWVLDAVRNRATRDFLLDRLESVVWKLGEKSWAELVGLVPAERVGPWLAAALESEPGSKVLEATRGALIERVLTTPIGSPGRFAREDAAHRLAEAIGPPLWGWIGNQVPEIADRVKVSDRVESKILEFPLPELERLVRSVTQHELDVIVRLGYVLGAVIGSALVLVQAVLG
jgi:uncharacterized membrane protein YheB (UPF0754 family)